MWGRFAIVLLVAGAAAIGALVSRHTVREAPLLCSIDALPTRATTSDVAHLCGLPYTSNVSFEANHQLDQWVYDAGTFLWFRDGVLAFEKVDERHVPEQAAMSHKRGPFNLCS